MLLNKLKHAVSAITQRNLKPLQVIEFTPANRKLRLMDLYILKHLETPLTDEQLTRAYNRVRNRPKAPMSSLKRRRYELVRQGFVHDTGTVVKGKYSRNMTVWATTKTN